jgi:hypothetical protein
MADVHGYCGKKVASPHDIKQQSVLTTKVSVELEVDM